MAEDWLVDVRKYAGDADEGVVGAIVRYCGIALQSRDGQLVAMSDKKERELVRENYLKKKLGLTHSDAELDEGVLAIGDRMKADRTKNRVTVYYLLAERFGALNVFGGGAGTGAATGVAAGAAGLAAMGASAENDDDANRGSAAPLAAAGIGAAGLAAAASMGAATPATEPLAAASMPPPSPVPPVAPARAAADYSGGDDVGGGGLGWLKWLLLAAVVALLLFFLLRSCSGGEEATSLGTGATTEATGGETADAVDTETVDAVETAAPDTAENDPAAAAAIPTGSGVVAGERVGKPMLTVYFDSGKADVTQDFAKVAAVIKDYTAKNPGAKLAVSGYNDPTGNAKLNAELSKRRAQAVGKSLEGLGIATAAIALVKPEAATDQAVDKAAARRVEVTVQ